MTEAERLQRIVETQEGELRRLRKLLSVARIASASFDVIDGKLMVTVTAIGVDEYYFTEQARPELLKIAEAILQERGARLNKRSKMRQGEKHEKHA
jgi:hypothetical protein